MPDEKNVSVEPQTVDGGEREAIYKQYQAGAASVKAEEKPVDKKEEKPVEMAAEKTEEKQPDFATEVINEKEEKEKVVPYNALKEEREKRKAIAQRAKELEERLVKAEAAKYAPNQEQEDETILDYEAELKAIKKQNKELMEWAKNSQTREHQKTQAELQKALADNIKSTDSELEKEGYPGFDLLKQEVTAELISLVREDPENVHLDNPEGWKKIFKEKVFPKAAEKFKSIERRESDDRKKELKKQAGLVTSSGKVEKPKTEEADMSFNGYLKRRGTIT